MWNISVTLHHIIWSLLRHNIPSLQNAALTAPSHSAVSILSSVVNTHLAGSYNMESCSSITCCTVDRSQRKEPGLKKINFKSGSCFTSIKREHSHRDAPQWEWWRVGWGVKVLGGTRKTECKCGGCRVGTLCSRLWIRATYKPQMSNFRFLQAQAQLLYKIKICQREYQMSVLEEMFLSLLMSVCLCLCVAMCILRPGGGNYSCLSRSCSCRLLGMKIIRNNCRASGQGKLRDTSAHTDHMNPDLPFTCYRGRQKQEATVSVYVSDQTTRTF